MIVINVTQSDIILSYEKLLIGIPLQKKFLFNGTESQNDEVARNIVRYAVRHYLYDWSPEEVQIYINKDIINKLCLKPILEYIKFPDKIKKNSYWYIAHIAYPEEIEYNSRKFIIELLEYVAKHGAAYMPKNYFSGDEGEEKIKYCIRYIFEKHLKAKNILDVYKFVHSSEFIKLLETYKIYYGFFEYYEVPIDILWDLLPEEQLNMDLYYAFRLNEFLRKFKRKQTVKKDKGVE